MVVVLLIFFFLFFHASAVAAAGPVDRATRAAVEVLVGCSLTVSDDMFGGGWGGFLARLLCLYGYWAVSGPFPFTRVGRFGGGVIWDYVGRLGV